MRALRGALLGIMVIAMTATSAAAAAAEKVVCPVCRVKEGATEAEKPHAFRTHEGDRYALCSQDCAKEFDADPAAYVTPSFPRPAPELGVSGLDGAPLSWESLRGRVVLVDFWATWCAPCKKSMPELQALHDRYAARGFTVLGVSIDEPKAAAKVKKFVASRKITYPIALDLGRRPAWERYHVKAVPAAFLVDREGRVVAQWTGRAANPTELEERLKALLGNVD